MYCTGDSWGIYHLMLLIRDHNILIHTFQVATLPETRHTIILDRKTKCVRKTLQKEGLGSGENVRDANADEKKGLSTLFKITLSRPFVFLFTEPITYASAIYNGRSCSKSLPDQYSSDSRFHLWPGLHLQRGFSTR